MYVDLNDYVDIDEILDSGLRANKRSFNNPLLFRRQQTHQHQQHAIMTEPPAESMMGATAGEPPQFQPSSIDYISIDDSATMALKNASFLGKYIYSKEGLRYILKHYIFFSKKIYSIFEEKTIIFLFRW